MSAHRLPFKKPKDKTIILKCECEYNESCPSIVAQSAKRRKNISTSALDNQRIDKQGKQNNIVFRSFFEPNTTPFVCPPIDKFYQLCKNAGQMFDEANSTENCTDRALLYLKAAINLMISGIMFETRQNVPIDADAYKKIMYLVK